MQPAYAIRILPVQNLAEQDRLGMESLYMAHYEASSSEIFQADLAVKDEVLLLYFAGRLAGFTTMAYYVFNWQGVPLRIVFSGDTVVDRAHWGQQHLSLGWIAHMGYRHKLFPEAPLYWFLLVKGHRTYRYLPVFAKTFYPHWSYEDPDLAALAAALAKDRFALDYNEASGILDFDASRGQLRQDIAQPKESESRKEAVQFFMRRNPGYAKGHELICLCHLCRNNLRSYAGQIFERGSYVCG